MPHGSEKNTTSYLRRCCWLQDECWEVYSAAPPGKSTMPASKDMFEYLNDDSIVTLQNAVVARVAMALLQIKGAIPAAEG